MILISVKNSAFVLAGITLVLKDTRFLNEYRPLFPVLQPEALDFYRVKHAYNGFHVAMFKYMQKLDGRNRNRLKKGSNLGGRQKYSGRFCYI